MRDHQREIKSAGTPKSLWTLFDLLGNDEVALTKAFAYVLGNERKVLSLFLKHVGVKKTITQNAFNEISIITERKRHEGRTDIEIELKGVFHVIVEAKVRGGKVTQQRRQYIQSFNPATKENVMVFLTQQRDSNLELAGDIRVLNTSWFDIASILDGNVFDDNSLVNQFLGYLTRNFRLNMLKEVLIQDVSHLREILRFKECAVYRREQTWGTPLYFAPYFTRGANQPEGEGIPYLSKILGVLTLNPKDIESFQNDLLSFKNDKATIQKWVEGVRRDIGKKDELMTYYFLDDPVRLKKNLLKDKGREKGRGAGWIAANIPKNRCVSFGEFVKRMNEH